MTVLVREDSVGLVSGPVRCSWTPDDAVLYALAVGLGPDALEYTTSDTPELPQEVLPTFLATRLRVPEVMTLLGVVADATVVHAAQRIELFEPVAAAGVLEATATIVSVEVDQAGIRGKVEIDIVGRRPVGGAIVAIARRTLVVRDPALLRRAGDGPTRPHPRIPHGAHQLRLPTRPEQALLFRLCGDRNLIHSAPSAAVVAGFDRPILHGMCTFGAATAQILAAGLVPASTVTIVEAAFSRPVQPGDALRIVADLVVDGVEFVVLGDAGIVLRAGRIGTRSRE
ncbi:MaoC/PaaZ C-terminal domain-containing protein [Microbacterium sp. NPDC055357]